MGLIFWASHQPGGSLGIELPPGSDKLIHGGIFGVLGGLLALARLGPSPRAWVGWAAALCLAWGGLDELHQAFVPGRTPELLDLVADSVGGAVGALGMGRWIPGPQSAARN